MLSHGAKELTFVANDAFGFIRECVGRFTLRVRQCLRTVRLILSQRGETKQGHGKVAVAFVWKIISVVNAAKSFNEWNPHACIGLKFRDFVHVNRVSEIAGYHGALTAILTNSVTKGCGTVCVDLSCGTKSVPTKKG